MALRSAALAGVIWALVALASIGPEHRAVMADTPPTDADDYDIPGGHFFTEGQPNGDQTGLGFAVFNGSGANLWTAFQEAGGVSKLGYPTSGRFEVNGNVAQAFSAAVLVWSRASAHVDVVQPSDVGIPRVPAYALKPEQPPLAAASVDPQPWSGWWWPASTGIGPTLFATDGPLARYDEYVQATGGGDPDTRDWEQTHVYFPNTSWAGHCNGFAAAAVLEAEPSAPVSVQGITFSVADLKGLLADYHFADGSAWSFGEGGSVNPADFHRMLLDWVQNQNKGFVVSFDLGGGETWSYPLDSYQSEWAPDAVEDGLWHVSTTVWMADMNVPPNFVGVKPYPGDAGKVFTYDLRGDPRHPTGGEWTGRSNAGPFAHPGQIWYPKPGSPSPARRELVSPALDRQTLDNILAADEGSLHPNR